MIDYGDLRVKHINQFLICLFADEVVVLGLYSSGSITPSLNISFFLYHILCIHLF